MDGWMDGKRTNLCFEGDERSELDLADAKEVAQLDVLAVKGDGEAGGGLEVRGHEGLRGAGDEVCGGEGG